MNKRKNICFRSIMNFRKTGISLLLFIIAGVFMTGCGNKEEKNKNENSSLKADIIFDNIPGDSELDKIIQDILNSGAFEGEMAKVNEKAVMEAYEWNDSNEAIQIYASYMSAAAKADEITVIRTDDLQKTERDVQNYIEARKRSFESYMPGEVKKIEEVLTAVYGTDSGIYILCICGDKETALKQIKAK